MHADEGACCGSSEDPLGTCGEGSKVEWEAGRG